MIIENPEIKIRRSSPDAKLPTYATDGSAGFDLYSIEDGELKVGKRVIIALGIEAEIPKDWCVVFIGKSGLASKNGIDILGGLIDPDYRGGWKVILLNTGEENFEFKKGDKITQGVILYAPQAKLTEVKELSESVRGTGGFGSTGNK